MCGILLAAFVSIDSSSELSVCALASCGFDEPHSIAARVFDTDAIMFFVK